MRTSANKSDEIDDILIEYIERFPAHLRHTGEFAPGVVYPNPASWHRLSQSLMYANMSPIEMVGENYNSLLLSVAKGFVGEATAFQNTTYVFPSAVPIELLSPEFESATSVFTAVSADHCAFALKMVKKAIKKVIFFIIKSI